jgi:hypothetical protein
MGRPKASLRAAASRPPMGVTLTSPMSRSGRDLDAAILSELESRVADLRGKSFEHLLSLPEAGTDQLEILGKRVTFTVFRERQDDGTLMILVRSDKPIFFGIGTAGVTRGFFVYPNEKKRDAFGNEISEFFA